MYAFKNPVYLVLGVVLVLFGVIAVAKTYALFGGLVVILGLAMSVFAAYQIGQSSPAKA